MSRKLLTLFALPLAVACSSEPEEEEVSAVDGEVFVPSEEAQQPDPLEDGEARTPTGQSSVDEPEDSVTAPESEATGKIQPIE